MSSFPLLPPSIGGPDRVDNPAMSWETPDVVGAVTAKVAPSVTAPTPVTSSRDLLTRAQRRTHAAPAQWGWQATLRRLSGGILHPGPGQAELTYRSDVAALRQSFSRPQTVMVANPKGGAGKTPTTALLAAALGQARGGYVLAWDDNETRGTLGVRAEGWDAATTVWHLLENLDRFESVAASVGDLAHYIRPQEARFDVLASDDDAARMAQIGQQEFERLRAVLTRFYRVIVVDTGNNLRAANWGCR